MDDGRLDRLEQALLLHARGKKVPSVPQDFTAKVMRAVRHKAERTPDFLDVFSLVARRFAPVGALAATVACGYAQLMERVFSQAVLSMSLHGGNAITLVGLMP